MALSLLEEDEERKDRERNKEEINLHWYMADRQGKMGVPTRDDLRDDTEWVWEEERDKKKNIYI